MIPSALAVLRLITSSNLVAEQNGISATFAPFKYLIHLIAAWRQRFDRSGA